MKKWLVLLSTMMLSILLAACGSSQGGEESAHPYSWKEKHNGSVQVTIQNAPESGYSWITNETENSLLQIVRKDNGNGEKAVFSVTGQDFTSGTVSFLCRRDSAPYDTSFQLNLSLKTSDKGKLQVISADYLQFSSGSLAGEAEKVSCTWYTTDDSSCALFIDSTSGDWSIIGEDDAILSIDGPSYDEEGCTYSLTGLSAGDTELLLYDLVKAYGFQLSVSVSDDLTVTVSNGKTGTFTIPATEIPGMSDVTTLLGEIALDNTVELLKCKVGNWYGGEEKDYAELHLRANEVEWILLATRSYSMQEFIALCDADVEGVTQTETTVGSFSAILCSAEDNYILFWVDNQGRTFSLTARSDGDGTQKKLQDVAEKLCAAQKEAG